MLCGLPQPHVTSHNITSTTAKIVITFKKKELWYCISMSISRYTNSGIRIGKELKKEICASPVLIYLDYYGAVKYCENFLQIIYMAIFFIDR